MALKKIVIVGLGLMGGSLAADCRKKFPKALIAGVSRNRKAVQTAKRNKWIHSGYTDIKKALPDTDLVILCTPVQTIPDFLKKIDQNVHAPILVTDVGSVKGSIERAAAKQKLKYVAFVGAHPMVGSHRKGIGAAEKDLYKNGLIFLIRSPRVSPAYREIKVFWRRISGRIIELSAGEHDRIVSEISHLPHILAASLAQAISQKSLTFASTGFKDTTRVAAGHESIWLPIALNNKHEILKSIKTYQNTLKTFQKALEKGDSAYLKKFLQKGRLKREQI